MIPLLFTVPALAFEQRPVQPGETVASIAAALGDPSLAAEIRRRNGLSEGAEPAFGQILTLPPPQGPHADQTVFLFSITGRVTITSPGKVEAAAAFTPLPVGSMICTGADSYASLRTASNCGDLLGASDDVLLSEETCVTLESAFASVLGRSSLLRVTRGSLTVAPSTSPGLVAIATESALTQGRSGGFRVHVERSATRAEALTGAVLLQGRSAALDLAIRTGSRVPLGGDPEPPTPLLPESSLISPSSGAPLRRPRFLWQPMEDAFAYQIEISVNAAFTAIVYAETVERPEHTASLLLLPSMAEDTLWWRVAATDRLGFLGIPTTASPFLVP